MLRLSGEDRMIMNYVMGNYLHTIKARRPWEKPDYLSTKQPRAASLIHRAVQLISKQTLGLCYLLSE